MNLPSLVVRWPVTMALIATVSGGGLAITRLMPESVVAWRTYTSATEQRMTAELSSRDRFLGIDFRTDAAASRTAVLGGQVVIQAVETRDARGQVIEIPSALLQHWRAVVFVPGTTAEAVMARLAVEAPPAGQDVVRSAVLARGPDRMKVYLQLRAQKIVTAYYSTEHEVTFARHGTGRGSTRSVATKVAELREFGTPAQYELPPGHDRGFLWRLNAYWRYQDVPGGVIAEVESLTLSRAVPSIVSYLVGPMIERTARESIERAVLSVRTRFRREG